MEPIRYLHLQLRLEGKVIVEDRLIREVEVVPGEDVPLLLIARLADGKVVAYFDEALSGALQATLAAHIANLDVPAVDPLLEVLREQGVQFEVGHYKTYVFPSIPVSDRNVQCLSNDDERVKAFGFDGFAGHVYVIEGEGRVVSACVSTREDANCGEGWVFTAPDHRRQGLAEKVVSAWAESLIRAEKVPFYSHKIDNLASANLAKRLGLQPVFEEIVILRA